MLKIGDKMPQFSVVDQNGNTVSSQDFIGKKTIIYFYPKDENSEYDDLSDFFSDEVNIEQNFIKNPNC